MQFIKKEDLYSNFINSLKSPETKKEYSYFLKVFMRFHNITSFSNMLENPEQKIRVYLIETSKRNLSKTHFGIMLAALRNFYEMNDIDNIKWNKLKRFIGETKAPHKDRAYSHEEILTLVNNCNLKMKAIILLLASSGIRVGALPNLKLSHLERKNDLYKISVYEGQKGKGHYITFCTPEASKKKLTFIYSIENARGEKLSPESPLFRKDFDSQFREQARNKVEPIRLGGFTLGLHRLLIKTGVKQVNHVEPRSRKEVKLAHGLRKFFITQLVNAQIFEIIIKKLSGHSNDNDMTFLYSRQTDVELLAAILQCH